MNNQSFIPYQRLELKNMSTEKIISIIRVAATNYDDTSLILTPRIDQSGQAYYWTGLRYGGCTELDFKLPLNKEIEAFILCFLLKGKDGHNLAAIPHVPSFGILSRSQRLYQNKQRQDIPEQETDIPLWKHSLFAGNQGCIFNAATMRVKQAYPYMNKGTSR